MVTVKEVVSGSVAESSGFKPGDIIIEINGNTINDVLDYRFYLTERSVKIKVHRCAELFDITIKKGEYDDIGLEFETYLMDKKHCCKNKCIFCFIDQMPSGCRPTLYFKDDDSRLSYLMGNYVTLTNLPDEEIDRIIKMRLSPLNISVHTTDPELRVYMMKNPRAAEAMPVMRKLADGGIYMNGQIVLCRNINDGEALARTMSELESLYPYMQSVSVVPCGLTDHRQGLYEIESFSSEEAAKVVEQVEAFAAECMEKHGSGIFFCGDEFYIKGGLDIPDESYYEGYPQLENGVGMVRDFIESFAYELDEADGQAPTKTLSAATGEAAYEYIRASLDALEKKYPQIKVNLYKIKNNFFGKNITVAGLVTGADLISQLDGKVLGEKLIIPDVMLRAEGDLFLDGVSLDDVKKRLCIDVAVVTGGDGLVREIIYN